LSPIGQEILTIGMMSEYTIVYNKNNDSLPSGPDNHGRVLTDQAKKTSNDNNDEKNISEDETNSNKNNSTSKSNFSVKVLQPVLTAYTSRTGIINNRPTIIETGLAYGGDINSFKLYRFANKIPLLYDEGSDVAREVVSEVEINKMGITKKQAKEQFSTNNNKESKRDRVIEVLPIHIFFHVCSTKIPYKTAGKESIASEGELKYYMKSCLSELYRKLSTQIRKELKMKEAENKMKLYKHYLPFIVEAITDSLGIKNSKLNESFSSLIEKHLTKKTNVDSVDDEHGFSVVGSDSHATPSSRSSGSGNKDKSPILGNAPKTDAAKSKNTESKYSLSIYNQIPSSTPFTPPHSPHTSSPNGRSKIGKNSNKNNGDKGSEKPVSKGNQRTFKETLKKNSKIKNKEKIKASDAHSTLDYYQRRVNKGKIK
jgi:DNA topoisomerase-6 subunit B